MGKVVVAVVAASLFVGCAAQRQAAPRKHVTAQQLEGAPEEAYALNGAGRRYIDPELGFEISRPDGTWQLDADEHGSGDGLVIPVVLRHEPSGAQVVLQVAPAVATPTQFAERLTTGLRTQPGFVASDPEPLPLSDTSVGFQFAVGDKVKGRVAVQEGGDGQVFLMMATWPADARGDVSSQVQKIFESLRAVPRVAKVAPRPQEHAI